MNTPGVMPQNREAEAAVIGAIITTGAEIVPDIAAILSPSDFYLPSNQRTFAAILNLQDQGQPIDLITVSESLRGQDIFAADLAGMADSALPFNAVSHAQIVKEASQRRQLLTALRNAEAAIYEGDTDSATIASGLGSCLIELQSGRPEGFTHVEGVMIEVLKEIESAHQGKNPVVGVPPGLASIDNKLGGISRGDLIVVAGRPGMGKTALAETIGTGAASRGYGVAFVTAETPKPKIVQRMLSAATGIENRNLRRGIIEDREFGRIVEKAGRIGALPFWLLDRDRNWDRIKAKIRSLKLQERSLQLVIVDYVGLLSAPVPGKERYLEVGRISAEAKTLAIELNVGFVLCAQLNREVENRTDKRPKLSDLRESGNLEQDADSVWLLFREGYYNDAAKAEGVAELDIAKFRDGATGIIKLRFDEKTVSFHDIEP